MFLIDLDSIHNKLSSDYSLGISFSGRFSYTDGQSFFQYKPLMSIFERQLFRELYSPIDKNLGEKVRGCVSRRNNN